MRRISCIYGLVVLVLSLSACASTAQVEPIATDDSTVTATQEVTLVPASPTVEAATVEQATNTTTAPLAVTSTATLQEVQLTCADVETLAPDTEEVGAILDDLRQGIFARASEDIQVRGEDVIQFTDVRPVKRVGEWVLVQTAFQAYFEPGIFVLQTTSEGYEYSGVGWGGVAQSRDEIRDYLTEQAPQVPEVLFQCFDPAEWFSLS